MRNLERGAYFKFKIKIYFCINETNNPSSYLNSTFMKKKLNTSKKFKKAN